jgi:DNA-binding response OmpR family regulator
MALKPKKKQLALITENDQNILTFIAEFLQLQNFNVLTARNGFQALEIAKIEQPDMIFIDLQTPLLDGCDAIRLIRLEENLKSIPIIAITCCHDEIIENNAFQAGCNYYLKKPLKIEELKIIVNEHS